jgi:hypothetical protein
MEARQMGMPAPAANRRAAPLRMGGVTVLSFATLGKLFRMGMAPGGSKPVPGSVMRPRSINEIAGARKISGTVLSVAPAGQERRILGSLVGSMVPKCPLLEIG